MLLLEWINGVPPVTRTYLFLIGIVTLATHLELCTPYSLFFSKQLVIEGQYWRLFTSFLYLGSLGFDWLLHVYFLCKYCEQLEGQFRNRTAGKYFLYEISFGCLLSSGVLFA
jgi:Derlin-2/3